MEVVRRGPVILQLTKTFLKQSTGVSGTQICRCAGSSAGLARGSKDSNNVTSSPPPSEIGNAGKNKAKRISMAMRAYLQRAQAHEAFLKSEISDFEIGKRHLANIMSLDPDSITQEDIDKAIRYLLPSGLFDKKARPIMKHPHDVIPARKAAQFDEDGRPFHYQFYTMRPNYFALMHELVETLEGLKALQDTALSQNIFHKPNMKINLGGSQWVKKSVLEERTKEKLTDAQYENSIKLLERIAAQPYAYHKEDDIMAYREVMHVASQAVEVPPLMYDEQGVGYMTAEGRRKKSGSATVTVRDKGTGKVIINGTDLLGHFQSIYDREQILFPLQFTGKLQEVDFEAQVEGNGKSCQAGALRLALARALRSFVDRDMVEKMRIAGLLTQDVRTRERKKPGQEGARRKYTWKKR